MDRALANTPYQNRQFFLLARKSVPGADARA
jgi:hypothetical protein